MKKTDLAYYAGIFDGEGCVTITLYGNKLYQLRCKVSNTNEWLIQSLRMTWGGHVYRDKRTPNHRACYEWYIVSWQAAIFLEDIYPYLRLKKPQVDVALQFQAQKDNIHNKNLTDGRRAIWEAQRILVSNLKRV